MSPQAKSNIFYLIAGTFGPHNVVNPPTHLNTHTHAHPHTHPHAHTHAHSHMHTQMPNVDACESLMNNRTTLANTSIQRVFNSHKSCVLEIHIQI